MATLNNTRISDTYHGLIKTLDNTAISATLKQLSDGDGNATGLSLNNAGDFKVNAILEFGSLKDSGENIIISKFVDAADGIGNNDNDTSIPTSAAIVSYVASVITAEDLDFTGDDAAVSGDVDLNSEKFRILGTVNEIETLVVSAGGNQLKIGIPTNPVLTGIVTASTFSGDLNGTINTATTAVTQTAGNNSTKVATTAYVDTLDAASDLDFKGDSGTGDVTLNSQIFNINGTANEITTTASGNDLTISLPTSISVNLVGNVTGNLTGNVNGNVAGDLTGNVTATSVLANGVTATTQGSGDSSTKVATTAFVKSLDNASDLDFSGNTGTGDVTLNSQTLGVTGIANEIVTTAANQGLTVGFPTGGVTLPNGSVATTQASSDDSTKIATTAYVKGLDNASDLDITDGTTTGDVNLNTQSLSILGTSNQVVSTVLNQGVTLSLPSSINVNSASATILQSARDISLTGEASATISGFNGSSSVSGAVTLDNDSVTEKVLTGLSSPTATNILASDSILQAFGKTQSQLNTLAGGLRFMGTWNATTNTPTLASGGGEAASGTTSGTTANKLVDSSASFTSTVTTGDQVVNQESGATALVTNIDSNTVITIDADIMVSGQTYTIDNSPFLQQGHYFVVSVGGTSSLNGLSNWAVGDWVIAGSTNVWEKLDHTQVDGTGTVGNITKWSSTNVIADSIMAETGSGASALVTTSGSFAATQLLSSGGNFSVNTNKFTANATTGNIVVAGDINIGGALYKNAGDLIIKGSAVRINGITTNENLATFVENGQVELYYNNAKKFETTSVGVTITGRTTANSFQTVVGTTDFSLLTRNSANTAVYIQQSGTGDILDVRYGSQSAGQGTSAFVVNNSGNATFAGNVTISKADTPLFQLIDTTNNISLLIGADNSNTFFRNSAGNMIFQTAGGVSALTLDSSQNAIFPKNLKSNTGLFCTTLTNAEPFMALQRNSGSNGVGVLRLLDGGDLTFDTGANGAGQATRLTIDGSTGNATFAGNVFLPDNKYATFGGANNAWELQIGVVGDNAFIEKTATNNGDLFIKNNGSGKGIIFQNGGATALTIDSSQNSTFAGNVNISSPGDLYINSGTSYNNKGSIFISNQRTEIVSDIVDGTANGDTSLNFKTRKSGATASAMFIDEFRKIGIGTEAPATKLHIGGTAPGDSIIRQDSTASGTNWEIGERAAGKWQIFEDDSDSIVATFMSSGRVGIGTDSPAAKFEVTDGTSSITLQEYQNGATIFLDGVNGDFSGGDYYHIIADGADYLGLGGYGGGATPLNVKSNGRVGVGTSVPVKKLHISDTATGLMTNILCVNRHDTNGDTAGIAFSMTDTDLFNKAAIYFERTTAQGIGDLHFAVNNTGSSANVTKADSRMVIKPSGNVGIGTGSFAKKPLDVSGATGGQLLITGANDAVGTTAGILLRAEGGESDGLARVKCGIFFERIAGSFGNGKLKFAVNGAVNNDIVTVADTAMTIDNNKNVGIGTDSPQEKLHIVNAAAAGVNNFMLKLQNTTTVADSRSGILFSMNNSIGSDRDGFAIQGSNNGVDGQGNLLFGSVLNNAFTEKMRITSEGSIYNVNANSSTFFGLDTGNIANQTGGQNTGFGHKALEDMTSGAQNTGLGAFALENNTSGSRNTAVGYAALFNGSQGATDNTAVGVLALKNATSGSNNIAIGRDTGENIETGAKNTFVGTISGNTVVSGFENIGLGYNALKGLATGSGGIAIGISAGNFTSGNGNIAMGYAAMGTGTVTGSRNISIGDATGFNISSGGNNILIGTNAGRTGSQTPQSLGSVTTNSNEIQMGNNSHSGAFIKIAWTVTSDKRDKTNFKEIPLGLDFVSKLKPTSFEFKKERESNEADGIERYGFLAQDVLELEGDNPVIINNDNSDSLKYTSDHLVPVLVKAIQELKAEIELLKAK